MERAGTMQIRNDKHVQTYMYYDVQTCNHSYYLHAHKHASVLAYVLHTSKTHADRYEITRIHETCIHAYINAYMYANDAGATKKTTEYSR